MKLVTSIVVLLLAVVVHIADASMTWTEIVHKAPWGVRSMPRGGDMGGNFYIIGGRAGALTIYGDTWRSPDGINWTKQSDKPGWKKRAYPEVSVVDGSLILTGGQSTLTFYNDVWRSDDEGVTWYVVNKDAPWGRRAGHYTLVVDDSILLFAGAKNSFGRKFYNELWVSDDKGSTWELRSTLPEDMGRAGMQVIFVNGVLYFMGGDHDNPVFRINTEGRRNDVWRSTDMGVTWDNLGNASWSPRTGQQCALVGARIVCIGGEGANPQGKTVLFHDVWSWNPLVDAVDAWKLESLGAWGCGNEEESCGKDDFAIRVRGDVIYTFGGDEELSAPYPQDNSVWTAQIVSDRQVLMFTALEGN